VLASHNGSTVVFYRGRCFEIDGVDIRLEDSNATRGRIPPRVTGNQQENSEEIN
jgi:hypothetical protein